MTNQNAGTFKVKDRHGKTILLEWQKTMLFSPEFATSMKEAWPLAREAYTPVEMEFLKAYPEVVGTEGYFKPFEPIFKDGLDNVDWVKTKETMQTLLKSHFIFDSSTLGAEITAKFAKDTCYVVMAKDKQTNNLVGFITFLVRANYAPGDIKVMSFAVGTAHQNRGLGKILLSSILKISPSIKRIFACTRATNNTARRAYSFCGFTKDDNPVMDHMFNMNHWVFLEYKTERSEILQDIANKLVG